MGNTLDKHVREHAGQARLWYSTSCFEKLFEVFPMPTSYDFNDFGESQVSSAFQHSPQTKINLSAFRIGGDVSLQGTAV